MVALDIVKASNASLPKNLPSDLVAVFAGGTSGIGEATLTLLAKSSRRPRIYIVGRSRDAAERIIAQCRTDNSEGSYVFIQKELDLMSNVEEVCKEISGKEEAINLLFLSAGGPDLSRSKTSEGLHRVFATHYYGRILFIQRLLPLLRNAASLSRVVCVAGGGHEGIVYPSDFPALTLSVLKLRSHSATMKTLAFEHIAMQAPEVSFISAHPGTVVTKSVTEIKGALGVLLRLIVLLFGRWITVPLAESAERHLFLATSATFAPENGKAEGVSLVDGLETHVGTNGKKGSGVYSLKWDGEGPSKDVIELLSKYRKDGTAAKIWEHTDDELQRVLK